MGGENRTITTPAALATKRSEQTSRHTSGNPNGFASALGIVHGHQREDGDDGKLAREAHVAATVAATSVDR